VLEAWAGDFQGSGVLLTTTNTFPASERLGEAVDRMGIVAVENILSVLDGKPICDNVVNKEILD
jgi:hypothetical protein